MSDVVSENNLFQDKIEALYSLLKALESCQSFTDKVKILNGLPIVKDYLSSPSPICSFLKMLAPESEYALKSIIAIGQAPVVFNIQDLDEIYFKRLVVLLEQLVDLEAFYSNLGGIIGYHATLISLIDKYKNKKIGGDDAIRYLSPKGNRLDEDSPFVWQAVRSGIESISKIAAIYPVGGAGDRLDLKDDRSGESLPVARLPFLGRTLLDGLIRDLQGHEYLHYKLTGHQVTVPVVIMTSSEKNNHLHILEICKKADWFGRPHKQFHFFLQPLVPVVTEEGNWSLTSALNLYLKPCGHGVLWKLAQESGVFEWLRSQNIDQCFVRQINNPIGGIDKGLLALVGFGCKEKKAFGFLSCERLLGCQEGANVILETKTKNGYCYSLTNVEYTEFEIGGLGEERASHNSPSSTYPANTNLLFANLTSIEKALGKCQIPGQLINMKTKVPFINTEGTLNYVQGGRLESTMQNIADYITTAPSPHPLEGDDLESALGSFLLYNAREKTISPTKRAYVEGGAFSSTPEQAYWDLLSCNFALLKQCGFTLPPWKGVEETTQTYPSCIFLFHPGLGPLFSIIEQKIRHGTLSEGAELQIELAEVFIDHLALKGSLLIQSTTPLGYLKGGILRYGAEPRCFLKNLTIDNRGIDTSSRQCYWKNDPIRHEEVRIVLHEGAEFRAENLVLQGTHVFEVPAHCRLTLVHCSQKGWKGELVPIQKPSWRWDYAFDEKNRVKLSLQLYP